MLPPSPGDASTPCLLTTLLARRCRPSYAFAAICVPDAGRFAAVCRFHASYEYASTPSSVRFPASSYPNAAELLSKLSPNPTLLVSAASAKADFELGMATLAVGLACAAQFAYWAARVSCSIRSCQWARANCRLSCQTLANSGVESTSSIQATTALHSSSPHWAVAFRR